MFLALLAVSCGSQALAKNLRGVGVYESNDFKGISVSMAGGGYLNIAGQDGSFDSSAIANQLTFKTSSLSDESIEISLPRMSEDDQYMSSPISNRLVYTTPSISDLFNGTPLSSFEYLSNVDMSLSVMATSTETEFTCGSNCRVRYTWDYTPIIHYLVPAVVYPGMTVSAGINPRNAPNYKKSTDLPLQLRIDGTSLDLTNKYDETINLSKNKLNFVTGVVDADQRRNATAEVTAFFRGAGYAMNDTQTMPVCLYDGVTCYNSKVMSTVSSVSHNSGFHTGGQNLTITGTSLESDNIVITVDDMPCVIKNQSDHSIICTTTPKTIAVEEVKPADNENVVVPDSGNTAEPADENAVAPDAETVEEVVEPAPSIIGQQGLTKYRFQKGPGHQNWRDFIDDGDKYVGKSIWTSLDLAQSSFLTNSFDAFTGFFKAPETAEYRFLMACDDSCTFKISLDEPMNPENKTELLSGKYTSYRNTDIWDKSEENNLFEQRFSKWVSLTKDQHYFIETTLGQGGGSINLNVGMEIKPENMPTDHVKLERQVQQISLGMKNQRYDTMEIMVVKPDDGEFKMAMLKPTNTSEFFKTENIKSNASADTLRSKIQKFYTSQYGVSPVITKTLYDSSLIETTEDGEDIYQSVYTIQVPTAIGFASVDTIMLLPLSTKSKFTIVYPKDKQLSTPPLAGKFFMECHSPDGKSFPTKDMLIKSASANSVKARLEADCGFLKGKIQVSQLRTTYPQNADGIEFRISFSGISADLKQYRMISSIEDPPEYWLENPLETSDEQAVEEESQTAEGEEGSNEEPGDSGESESSEASNSDSSSADANSDAGSDANSDAGTDNSSSDSGSAETDSNTETDNSGGRRLQETKEPVSIVKTQSIVRPFGTALVWHTIPAEYFFTHETSPQIKVSIDGMPALCTGMSCDYKYLIGESQITAFTLTDKALSITGTNFVTPVKIEMGFISCENIVVAETADSITCDLTDDLPGGSWLPEIYDESGLVQLKEGVTPQDVTITITSVRPKSDLNPAGGDLMTIDGTNFPPTIDPRYQFQIILDDKVLCIPYEQTKTQIKCETNPFTQALRRRMLQADSPFVMKVQVTDSIGITEIEDTGFTLDQNPVRASAITPQEISPISLQTIVIQLVETYPVVGMTIDDFKVKLVPETLEFSYLIVNNGGERELNVVAVDSSAKTITVKYGGAYSGTYDIYIKSLTNGNVDTRAIQLKAVFELKDFSPKTGSIYGGTKLTLTGGPFTDALDETIVKVGYKWWEGINHYCYVISVSHNEVTCRLPLDLNREAKEYTVIMFASTYEESNCEMDNDCKFTFIAADQLPQVTGPPVAEFHSVSGKYRLKIPMTGNTDTDKDIDFMIAGKAQTIISSSEKEIVVQIDDALSGLAANSKMDLYLSQGIPEGFQNLVSVNLAPKLLSLSTKTGSQAGSIITAEVAGAGINDKLTLFDTNNAQDLCETSKVIEYGKLECHTKAIELGSVQLSVKEIDSGTEHQCAAATATPCIYRTYNTETEQMTVSAVALSASTGEITFTGTNYPISADSCTAVFLGSQSDSCKIDSKSQVVATFSKGVPTTSTDSKPQLFFVKTASTDYALVAESVVLQNPLSVTAVSSGLQSSFAGGQTLSVTANGLGGDIKENTAEIRVCQKPCSALDSSTPAIFKCSVPPIATTKSNSEFKIQDESNLTGKKVIYGGMTEAMAKLSLDGDILPSIQSTTENCFVGIEFAAGYVGVLNEISFFLDEFSVDHIVSHLFIQGSTDNFVDSIEELVQVGEEAHEGWNYYDLTNGKTEDPVKYQYYRLTSDSITKGCDDIGEIHFIGYEVLDNDQDSYACDIELVEFTTDAEGVITETVSKQSEQVTYSVAATPVLDEISPRYGAVSGGTQITFTGKNFDSDSSTQSDIQIILDDVECPIDSFSATEIKCTTAARIGEWKEDPKVEILQKGQKNVALQGNLYRYCALWSEESTWGNLFPPVDGESVAVPKGLCLLVDIKHSPKLRLVQVDGGALIFPSKDDQPDYHATFDARYIMVNNGTMEIGTEKNPYMSKLTITMYGEKYDPAMPIFGKKSIGVSFGTLDIHGAPKLSWTDLDSTVEPAGTELTVVEEVDWVAGDHIMITSTDYSMYQAEFFDIISVTTSGGKSTIVIDGAFKHKHYAAVETHGTDTLTIRAEVCLMSRNIVYRGDPETSAKNKFGAHIMLHSPGDETVVGRIENLQLNDVGQAFLLGKYPIHFHMIGRVNKSYVRNNAIMRSYNRGTTIHGVKYLRVQRNCYWDVMGHTIFVEDAAETKNLIEYNVVAGTKPSFSLLNTDQTPGCFWITHPDNIFVGNRAAGSSNYGYWMDYQNTAIGPSFDPNIKPTKSKLGEFRNNIAHSVGNYGLRIFHGHEPPQVAYYEDHLSYRCGKNGVMGGDLGRVVFRNITVADNANSGIEFERIHLSPDEIDVCHAIDLVVIGRSNGNPGKSTHGIVAPQSDLWFVTNARFYNFQQGAAALGDCAHCETPKADSGCRTTRFSKLMFDSTVEKKIKWRWPFKGIFHDLDGTLTGQGPDSYVSAYWPHNEQPECSVDMDVYDGIICPSPYAIERIVFTGASGPADKDKMYIWQYDLKNTIAKDEEALANYLTAPNGSEVQYLEKANPTKHWTAPYVTQHKYYVRWLWGLDFDTMSVRIKPFLWEESDKNVHLVSPFVEVRAAIEFTPNKSGLQANNTLKTTPESEWIMGTNVVYNATENRTMEFIVNAKDESDSLFIKGRRCIVDCELVEVIEDNGAQPTRLWSDVANWPNLDNRIPIAGEKVLIQKGYDIIYDIGTSPIFESIEINGKLTFQQGQPAVLQAYGVWIRAGEVNIGTAEEPFNSTAEIRLHGNNTSPTQFVFSEQIPVGNKHLIVTGQLNMFGTPRQRVTRLTSQAYPGNTKLFVPQNLDFVKGDKLGLPATNNDPHQSETVEVESYDAINGIVELVEPLVGYHFGAFASTADDYQGVDMRGEVLTLSSNVNVTADTSELSRTPAYPDPYGCQILVSDFFEPSDFTYRAGSINFDNVAVYNCSQEKTEFAGIKFHNALTGVKKVTNSAISSGKGEGIIMLSSNKIELKNNVIHDHILFGIHGVGSNVLTIDNNVVNGVKPENIPDHPYMEWTEVNGGIDVSDCKDCSVTNNIVASTWHSGFRLPAHECDGKNPNYNNVAHSISGYGLIVTKSYSKKCSEFASFRGYKNRIATMQFGGGIGSDKQVTRDLVSIDSVTGLMALGATGGKVEVIDSYIYGDKDLLNKDCWNDINPNCGQCQNKRGILIPTFGDHKTSTGIAPKKLGKMFDDDGGWGGTSLFENIRFIGFNSDTNSCGRKQHAIVTNNTPNYHPIAYYRNIHFIDTGEKAMFNLRSPSQGWANLKDCGVFTCTGLYNVLLKLESTKYSGSPMPFGMPTEFQVTSNNKESTSAQVVPNCKEKSAWNAYLCQNKELGVMLFESQDADRMDRSSQPLYIRDSERGFDNRLNAYMDQCWDGAYTCQKREQRFPTFLEINRNYTIEYTGTPPQKQKFSLYGDTYGKGNLITIPYPDRGAYKVYLENGKLAIPTDWDNRIEHWAVPTGKYCGENRFNAVKNELEFWIVPDCTLFVYPRDAVMLAVRLEWTTKAFFQEGGIGKFTDRMAAALFIAKADLKVVQVYEGSVIVEFEVTAPEDDPDPEKTFKKIEKRFTEVVPTLGDSLGAPVMQIVTSSGEVVPMAGYEDLQSLQNNKGFEDLISQFLSERDAKIELQRLQDAAAAEKQRLEDEKNSSKDQDQGQDTDEESTPEDSNTSERQVITVKVTEIVEVEQITVVKETTEQQVTSYLIVIVIVMLVLVIAMLIIIVCRKKKRQARIILRGGAVNQDGEQVNTEGNQDGDAINIYDDSVKYQYDPNGRNALGFDIINSTRKNAKVGTAGSDSLNFSDQRKMVLNTDAGLKHGSSPPESDRLSAQGEDSKRTRKRLQIEGSTSQPKQVQKKSKFVKNGKKAQNMTTTNGMYQQALDHSVAEAQENKRATNKASKTTKSTAINHDMVPVPMTADGDEQVQVEVLVAELLQTRPTQSAAVQNRTDLRPDMLS